MRIITLTTCHNRREKTLQALRDLHTQYLPEGVIMSHTIVDDGSIDGTSDAVKKDFSSVEIIQGDGSLFWAGGMRLGWNSSVKYKSFDYLLVYNDDVRMSLDAVERLLKASKKFLDDGGSAALAVVGAFKDDEDLMSYGGVMRSSWWHPLRFERIQPPKMGYIQVDTMNMNACLITNAALNKVGFLSDYFKHGGADYEFGLKLKKSGGTVLLISGYVGRCQRNDVENYLKERDLTLRERYKCLLGVKGQPISQRKEYYKSHGGPLWIIFFLLPYLTLPIKHIFNK
jgi:GT2 family glycosyltransferase